jgi:hypothetical protein
VDVIERAISDRLTRIFGIPKVTYDHPGESQEQECVFVEVTKSDVKIKDAREVARMIGSIHVFAVSEKLPFGYFAKKIQKADLADTRGFFFGPEENVGTFKNIAERKFDFVFLFDSQYDPAIGTIDEIDFSITET